MLLILGGFLIPYKRQCHSEFTYTKGEELGKASQNECNLPHPTGQFTCEQFSGILHIHVQQKTYQIVISYLRFKYSHSLSGICTTIVCSTQFFWHENCPHSNSYKEQNLYGQYVPSLKACCCLFPPCQKGIRTLPFCTCLAQVVVQTCWRNTDCQCCSQLESWMEIPLPFSRNSSAAILKGSIEVYWQARATWMAHSSIAGQQLVNNRNCRINRPKMILVTVFSLQALAIQTF